MSGLLIGADNVVNGGSVTADRPAHSAPKRCWSFRRTAAQSAEQPGADGVDRFVQLLDAQKPAGKVKNRGGAADRGGDLGEAKRKALGRQVGNGSAESSGRG